MTRRLARSRRNRRGIGTVATAVAAVVLVAVLERFAGAVLAALAAGLITGAWGSHAVTSAAGRALRRAGRRL
jgi:multisubunit Na+/H+ antiporter MnhG subunit